MNTLAEATVSRFIIRINRHDPEGLLKFCTPNHVFTDSLGRRLKGHAVLLDAWQQYFALFPDYRINVANLFGNNSVIAVFGSASGTLAGSTDPGSAWTIPAAWRAIVRKNLVMRWQVFADQKPVYEVLARPEVKVG